MNVSPTRSFSGDFKRECSWEGRANRHHGGGSGSLHGITSFAAPATAKPPVATSPLTKLKLLLFPSLPPLLLPSLLLASVEEMTPAAKGLGGPPSWPAFLVGNEGSFLDEGNWRKESYGVPPRNADECGASGRRKLVGAIALTDHSAVARFEEERAVGPNRAQRVLGRMISNWRAVGPALLPAFTTSARRRNGS